jgi:amino acid transporter
VLTLRSIRQALGHLDPVLIDGIAAFVVFGLMAVPFIVTEHLLARQGPTTPLAWLLAVLLVAPVLTHRRFPAAGGDRGAAGHCPGTARLHLLSDPDRLDRPRA